MHAIFGKYHPLLFDFLFYFWGKKIDSNHKKKSKLRSWVNAAPIGEKLIWVFMVYQKSKVTINRQRRSLEVFKPYIQSRQKVKLWLPFLGNLKFLILHVTAIFFLKLSEVITSSNLLQRQRSVPWLPWEGSTWHRSHLWTNKATSTWYISRLNHTASNCYRW